MSERRNWAGNIAFGGELVQPQTLSELQAIVSSAPKVRALGTGHCFNHIAVGTPDGVQVSVQRLDGAVELDADRRRARVPAGIRYGDLATILDAQGWALHNYASLPHISVAGAVATGTHGSGDRNGTLASAVTGLEIVTATGDLVMLTQDDPRLAGAVVSMGLLGIVTAVELAIEPSFTLIQRVQDDVPRDAIRDAFDAVFSTAYSVSCFTTWDPAGSAQLWIKHREDEPIRSLPGVGGRPADGKRHPVPGCDPIHCTDQGTPGPSFDRLPHFKLEFTPSSGEELQTEYLVPREEATRLLTELESLAPRIHPLLQVSEWRTMRADEQWLSPAFGRDTVGIHFTWKPEPGVYALLPELDALLGPAGGRPHWGKLFDADAASVQARYPRFDDFARLVQDLDPAGTFGNEMTAGLLRGSGRIGR